MVYIMNAAGMMRFQRFMIGDYFPRRCEAKDAMPVMAKLLSV